jgi:hypothetical protein
MDDIRRNEAQFVDCFHALWGTTSTPHQLSIGLKRDAHPIHTSEQQQKTRMSQGRRVNRGREGEPGLVSLPVIAWRNAEGKSPRCKADKHATEDMDSKTVSTICSGAFDVRVLGTKEPRAETRHETSYITSNYQRAEVLERQWRQRRLLLFLYSRTFTNRRARGRGQARLFGVSWLRQLHCPPNF